ncbi:MAG: hypothetical protein J5570_05960 [Lachnospiraceae bacterium]|nr:hypothetical protein [Lachnospiraceae bacterium]
MGGIFLIVALVVIIVLAVIADKNTNKKFLAKYEEEHPAKDTYGDLRISVNDELLYTLGSGTLAGFKMWKISEIGSIAIVDLKGSGKQFSVLDRDGNVTKGEYLTPSKKPLKEKGYKSFSISGEPNDMIAFIRKYAPGIRFTVNNKEV